MVSLADLIPTLLDDELEIDIEPNNLEKYEILKTALMKRWILKNYTRVVLWIFKMH